MGTRVLTRCACGLEAETAVGSVRRSRRTSCSFPCLCEGCNDLVTANLLVRPPVCPECGSTALVPYDQTELIGCRGALTEASCWMQEGIGRDLVLTDGLYRCPRCNRMSLRFIPPPFCLIETRTSRLAAQAKVSIGRMSNAYGRKITADGGVK